MSYVQLADMFALEMSDRRFATLAEHYYRRHTVRIKDAMLPTLRTYPDWWWQKVGRYTRHLELHKIRDRSRLMRIFRSFRSLRKLSLHSMDFPNVNDTVAHLPVHLEWLQLSHCRITEFDWRPPNLTTLRLIFCTAVQPSGHIENFNRIQWASFIKCEFDLNTFKRFLDNNRDRLEKLSLTSISKYFDGQCYERLSALPNLKRLTLSDADVRRLPANGFLRLEILKFYGSLHDVKWLGNKAAMSRLTIYGDKCDAISLVAFRNAAFLDLVYYNSGIRLPPRLRILKMTHYVEGDGDLLRVIEAIGSLQEIITWETPSLTFCDKLDSMLRAHNRILKWTVRDPSFRVRQYPYNINIDTGMTKCFFL